MHVVYHCSVSNSSMLRMDVGTDDIIFEYQFMIQWNLYCIFIGFHYPKIHGFV